MLTWHISGRVTHPIPRRPVRLHQNVWHCCHIRMSATPAQAYEQSVKWYKNSDSCGFNFYHLLISAPPVVCEFMCSCSVLGKWTLTQNEYIAKSNLGNSFSMGYCSLKLIVTRQHYLKNTKRSLSLKPLIIVFHFLASQNCLFSHLPKHQSPAITFPDTSMLKTRDTIWSLGAWTCLPGCVKLIRAHMLVSEQELTLNQQSFVNSNWLRATIISPIDR